MNIDSIPGASLGASGVNNTVQALQPPMTTLLLETLRSTSLLRLLKAPLSTAQFGAGWLCCVVLHCVMSVRRQRNAMPCYVVWYCVGPNAMQRNATLSSKLVTESCPAETFFGKAQAPNEDSSCCSYLSLQS